MAFVMKASRDDVTAMRHAYSILLLPVMNSIVIPTVILLLTQGERGFGIGTGKLFSVFGALLSATLLIAGVAMIMHSIALFVRHGNGTLAPWDPTQALVIRGLYRYLRNPMKMGLILLLLGESIAFGSLPLLYWWATFTIVNVVYIRLWEEPGLRIRFGEEYARYCSQVGPWLPSRRPWRASNNMVESR